ncbi:MAG TPA: hypothetical protein PLQ76_07425, partial [bacterium]|nr:hypothetical protein [bacterium]
MSGRLFLLIFISASFISTSGCSKKGVLPIERPAPVAEESGWMSLDIASVKAAESEKKPLLVCIREAWNYEPCIEAENGGKSDSILKGIRKYLIPVKLNSTMRPDLFAAVGGPDKEFILLSPAGGVADLDRPGAPDEKAAREIFEKYGKGEIAFAPPLGAVNEAPGELPGKDVLYGSAKYYARKSGDLLGARGNNACSGGFGNEVFDFLEAGYSAYGGSDFGNLKEQLKIEKKERVDARLDAEWGGVFRVRAGEASVEKTWTKTLEENSRAAMVFIAAHQIAAADSGKMK